MNKLWCMTTSIGVKRKALQAKLCSNPTFLSLLTNMDYKNNHFSILGGSRAFTVNIILADKLNMSCILTLACFSLLSVFNVMSQQHLKHSGL